MPNLPARARVPIATTVLPPGSQRVTGDLIPAMVTATAAVARQTVALAGDSKRNHLIRKRNHPTRTKNSATTKRMSVSGDGSKIAVSFHAKVFFSRKDAKAAKVFF